MCDSLQGLVAAAYQADQQRHSSVWLASLPALPGPDGQSIQQSLLQCIGNISACPGSGWEATAKPMTAFAVALLEKGAVKAAELADLFDSEPKRLPVLAHCACQQPS